MNRTQWAAFVLAVLAVVGSAPAQDFKMPAPQKEHEWLMQFVGRWDAECEISMAPGQAAMKSKASETVDALGGFWIVSHYKGDMMGQPFAGMMTLGFDPQKNKFVCTWIDSSNSYLWMYNGTLGADGKTLTLEAQGPCPMLGGKLVNFRDVMQVQDKDHHTFTSSMQGDDGQWMEIIKISYTRK